MVGVKAIASDSDFQPALAASGSRLAVVKFTMAGCGPCVRITPAFNALSNRYPDVDFLEADVNACEETASVNGVSATPTFVFFRGGLRVDQYQGANAAALGEKIERCVENDPRDPSVPKGYQDLTHLVDRAGCQCLNESDDRGFANCLDESNPSYLESDCDEQLLITVAFSVPAKLFSVRLRSRDFGRAPKSVKVFANPPSSMDFGDAERAKPTQALELSEEHLRGDGAAPLCFVKFQNVQSVTLFVASNQDAEETTRIDHLAFIGTPVQFTNMSDFKRVAGKKGEGH